MVQVFFLKTHSDGTDSIRELLHANARSSRKTQRPPSWTRSLLQHQLPKALSTMLYARRWLGNPCTEWVNLLGYISQAILKPLFPGILIPS